MYTNKGVVKKKYNPFKKRYQNYKRKRGTSFFMNRGWYRVRTKALVTKCCAPFKIHANAKYNGTALGIKEEISLLRCDLPSSIMNIMFQIDERKIVSCSYNHSPGELLGLLFMDGTYFITLDNNEIVVTYDMNCDNSYRFDVEDLYSEERQFQHSLLFPDMDSIYSLAKVIHLVHNGIQDISKFNVQCVLPVLKKAKEAIDNDSLLCNSAPKS